uniref:Methyltransferase domain-containing protein n=1 Tax=Neobodo designis TaxID=312471 RepID=A0A7S1M0S0_NEODS
MDSSPTTANACGPPTLEQTLHGVEPVTRPVANSRAAYDRMAPIYDLMTASSEHEFTDRGIAALNARPGERICEFGFGTGRAVEQFARAVGPEGHVTGIDISPKMRDQALAKVRKAQVDGRVTLHLGDVSDDQDSAATALQKEPQKFDAVVHVLLSGADGSARDSSRRATCSIVAGGRRAVGARGAGTSHRAAVRPDLRVGAPCVSERRRLSPDLPGGNGPRRVPVGDQSDAGHRVFDVGSACGDRHGDQDHGNRRDARRCFADVPGLPLRRTWLLRCTQQRDNINVRKRGRRGLGRGCHNGAGAPVSLPLTVANRRRQPRLSRQSASRRPTPCQIRRFHTAPPLPNVRTGSVRQMHSAPPAGGGLRA